MKLQRKCGIGLAAVGAALMAAGALSHPGEVNTKDYTDDNLSHVSSVPEMWAGHSPRQNSDRTSTVTLMAGVTSLIIGVEVAKNAAIYILNENSRIKIEKNEERPWVKRTYYPNPDVFDEFINGIEALDDLPARDSKKKS